MSIRVLIQFYAICLGVFQNPLQNYKELSTYAIACIFFTQNSSKINTSLCGYSLYLFYEKIKQNKYKLPTHRMAIWEPSHSAKEKKQKKK